MTIRLLCAYDKYPANAIVTLDAGTEAGLIAAKQATATLTGGDTYFVPVQPVQQAQPLVGGGRASIKAGEQVPISLPEGQALTVIGAAGTVGTLVRTDAAGTVQPAVAIGAGSFTTPAYPGTQKLLISCLAGSVDVSVGAAVLGVATTSGSTVSTADGMATALRRQSMVAPMGLLPLPGSQSLAGDAVKGKIINSQIPAPGEFFAVSLEFLNFDTSAPMVIDGVKVAACPVHKTLGNWSGQLVWSAFVTFGGSQSVTIPAAVVGAGVQIVPSSVWSDVVYVRAIARTDVVGAPYLLRVAAHFPASANATVHPAYNGGNYAAFNADAANPGLKYATYAYSETLANLIANGSSTDEIGGQQNPINAKFYCAGLLQELLAFGDSIVQGVNSTSSMLGWPARVAMSSYGQPIQFSTTNYATAGQKTIDSLAIMKSILSKTKPKFAAFKAWSPNDGDTQANYDQAFGVALEGIRYCIEQGVIPIVLTSSSAGGYTWARIKAQNARVMALPPSVIKFDAAAILMDPANEGSMIPAFDSDHTHLTNLGYAALATGLLNLVKS